MRYSLLVPAVAAAVLSAAALVRRPPTATAGARIPDLFTAGTVMNQLPLFSCVPERTCCDTTVAVAVLVGQEDIWVCHTRFRDPVHIARDGREWDAVVPVLREGRAFNPDYIKIEVALDDRVEYGDFLRAAAAADQAGNRSVLQLVEPALPVYPRHGRGGGLEPGVR